MCYIAPMGSETSRTDEMGVRWTHVACSLCGADRPRELLVDSVWRDGMRIDFHVVRCDDCGFTYVTPRGVGEALENVAGGGAWSAAAAVNPPLYQGGLKAMREAGLPDGGSVIDVGCGYGAFLAFAAAQGYDVIGVDINPDIAESARERGFDVHTGDLRDLALAGGGADAVTMWDVIEHVDDPVGLLATARDVVRQGGLVFFHTGNARFQIPKARALKALRPNGGPYLASHQHISHFDPTSARRALEAAGLEPQAVFYAGTMRYPRWRKRAPMLTMNTAAAQVARLGGPLLTSAMGVLARRPVE